MFQDSMRIKNTQKRVRTQRERRHRRIRARVIGTMARPRLAVYRSLRYIEVQVIDDATGRTLAAASDRGLDAQSIEPFEGRGGKMARAFAAGKRIAERAIAKGVKEVTFDRGGFAFHGRIRALAEGARSGGLKF